MRHRRGCTACMPPARVCRLSQAARQLSWLPSGLAAIYCLASACNAMALGDGHQHSMHCSRSRQIMACRAAVLTVW